MTPFSRRRFVAGSASSLLHLGGSRALPALPASIYATRVLAKKPCGYWRLGEKAGAASIQDLSGGAHHGASQGGNVTLGQKGMLDRDPDTALVLSGGVGYVEIPSSPEFSQPTSGAGFTVEAWLRPDALDFTGESGDPFVHWLGKGTPGKHEWAFRFYTRKSARPNRISAYIFNADGGLGSGAYIEEKIIAGKWLHIVATYDPGDHTDPKAGVSIYKDGVLRASPRDQPGALYSAYKIAPTSGDAPVRLGTRDLKHFLTGALDEVAIYARVLAAREIADNYRAGKAG